MKLPAAKHPPPGAQLQFETGDERYAWLNNRLAVGEGRLGPSVVTYRVYTLEAD